MFSIRKNRMYLDELFFLINRKDRRSVRAWCLKNHLQIYKDSSGEFVIDNEFELTYNMPLIKRLKLNYGENWVLYYEKYKEGKLYKLLDFKPDCQKMMDYKVKGKLSSKLFGGSSK